MKSRGTETPISWTRWRLVTPTVRLSYRALKETLEGGQAFRWHSPQSGIWQGIWSRNLVRVRLDRAGRLQWSSPETLAEGMGDRVAHYFTADTDLARIVDSLPWRSDVVLNRVLEYWEGLRILRQPVEEALLSFLCSSNKQIVQIKQICEALANSLGEPIAGGHRALPSWQVINQASDGSIRACRTGYRAPYLKGTARHLATHPGYLDGLASIPYEEATRVLISLPGVGSKVANCVLLFGAGRIESFPVDTWIARAMTRLYGLHEWKPAQIATFGRGHFGPYAGLAQQYLFAGERNQRSPHEA
jgi:N-glycosylase/DNA lyase